MRRFVHAILGTTAVVLASAAPALAADGEFTSRLDRVLTGFESREWKDSGNGSASTVITLSRCRFTEHPDTTMKSLSLTLYRQRFGPIPDENRGTKSFWCRNSYTQSWGDVPESEYHFRLKYINGDVRGWPHVSANVKVRY